MVLVLITCGIGLKIDGFGKVKQIEWVTPGGLMVWHQRGILWVNRTLMYIATGCQDVM